MDILHMLELNLLSTQSPRIPNTIKLEKGAILKQKEYF